MIFGRTLERGRPEGPEPGDGGARAERGAPDRSPSWAQPAGQTQRSDGALGVATVELDATLRVTAWDDAVGDILGWTSTESRGCGFAELLLPGRARRAERARLAADLRAVADTGGRETIEVLAVDRDGAERVVELVVRRLPDGRRGRSRSRFQVRVRDLTSQAAATDQQRQSEVLLAQAEELGRMGVCVWEPGTDEMTWSAGLYRLLDRDPDHAAPTFETWIRCVHPADRDRAAREVMAAISGSDRFEVEYRICRRDDRQLLARCLGTVERDEQGRPHRVLCTIRDVTSEAIVEHRKDEFLAVTSHELRTPLTAVHGALTLLGEGYAGSLSEKAAEMVAIALRGSNRLTRLVSDLLDAERLAAGAATLEVVEVNLAETVQAALDDVPEPIGSRLVRTEIPADLTAQVDPLRLRRVVAHLVSNAIKCTEDRGGWIRISVETSPNGLTLHIRDNGRGFAPDATPFMFDRFSQVQASLTRDAEGAGLGLAIVKQIVELHAGAITATSDGLGRGATFTVHLPQRPADAVRPADEPTEAERARVPATARSRAPSVGQAPGAR